MRRPRTPPGGYPTSPGTKEMPVLPLNFDTILGLGGSKLRATCLYPSLKLPGRFETLAVVVNFLSFWAGKLHRHAIKSRRVCYSPPSGSRLPDNKKQKYESEGSNT